MGHGIGDLIGRIAATTFLCIACGGGVWAVAEFIIFAIRGEHRKEKKK